LGHSPSFSFHRHNVNVIPAMSWTDGVCFKPKISKLSSPGEPSTLTVVL
jgi:hypothetical protein